MWEVLKVFGSKELEDVLNAEKVKPENIIYFGEEFEGFGTKVYSFLIYRETKKPRKKAKDE